MLIKIPNFKSDGNSNLIPLEVNLDIPDHLKYKMLAVTEELTLRMNCSPIQEDGFPEQVLLIPIGLVPIGTLPSEELWMKPWAHTDLGKIALERAELLELLDSIGAIWIDPETNPANLRSHGIIKKSLYEVEIRSLLEQVRLTLVGELIIALPEPVQPAERVSFSGNLVAIDDNHIKLTPLYSAIMNALWENRRRMRGNKVVAGGYSLTLSSLKERVGLLTSNEDSLIKAISRLQQLLSKTGGTLSVEFRIRNIMLTERLRQKT